MLKGCFIILFSLITFATYASGFIGVFNKKNKVIEYYETEEGDDYDDQQQVLLNEADSLISESVKQIDFSAARDSLTDTLIVVPETLADDIDTMLADWFLRNHTYVDSTCVSADYIVDVPDSVYMQRLGALPCIIDMPYNSVIKQYIELYSKKRRKLVEYMLGLGNYYFPVFEEVLDKYDMPAELKYLPVIESALKPMARSKAGAVGLWQFMLPTGKSMGLEINSLIDERSDTYKASDAAARYLKKLYDIYNDWHLAIAAYNCGPGNVNKAIRRSGGKKSYWDIYFYLPRETRGYVPAFIAATYIMTYHCEHNLCPVVTEMPVHTDTVFVDKMVHFEQISEFLDIPIEQLRMLNPQYRRDIVPGNVGAMSLRLPVQQLYTFIDNQDTIMLHRSEELLVNAKREISVGGGKIPAGTAIHRVRSGETLGAIARKYNISVSTLKSMNGLRSDNIRVGQQLSVAGKTSGTQKTGVSNEKLEAGFLVYKVKSGETLWKIANQHPGVTADMIRKANNMKNNNLKAGQNLKIPKV